MELGKFQCCETYLVAGHGAVSSAAARASVAFHTRGLGEVRAERGFGKGVRGEKRGTAPPPPPSTVCCRPLSTAAGGEGEDARDPLRAHPAHCCCLALSTALLHCALLPPLTLLLLLTDPAEGEWAAPPHRSRRGRVRESRDQGRERLRGKRETGEGGTDRDLGV